MGFWSDNGKDIAKKTGKAAVGVSKKAGAAVKEKSTKRVTSHSDAWDKKNDVLASAIKKAESRLTSAKKAHSKSTSNLETAKRVLANYGDSAPKTKQGQQAGADVAKWQRTFNDTKWKLERAQGALNDAKTDHAAHAKRKDKKASWM